VTIRVLIADDDADFLDVTAYALSRAGFSVRAVPNGTAALETWRAERPDIVLLDVGMADASGIQVCEAIRSRSSTPVVLLSGTRREADVIQGFDVGADDYVTKPISLQHLVRRLRAIHRRTAGQIATEAPLPKHLSFGPLEIDLDAFVVTAEGRPLRLTQLELRLLYFLAANRDRVVTTSRLIDFAWGMDGEADASLLKTHISHIRRKLREATDRPLTIQARPGLGYMMQFGAAQPAST
jgi:two-component system response regulator RegX3